MLEHNTYVADCLEDAACSGLFASLIDVLKNELALYSDLRAFLKSEKEMIMNAPSIEKINASNASKENLILKVRIVEEVRSNVLKKLARGLDLSDSSIRLLSVMNYAMPDQRRVLEELRADIAIITGDIHRMNNENSYLLDTSVSYFNKSLEFITSLTHRSGIYQVNGKVNEIRQYGSLLQTEG